jgi:hypothetical protein
MLVHVETAAASSVTTVIDVVAAYTALVSMSHL